jgi:hypothetical protein
VICMTGTRKPGRADLATGEGEEREEDRAAAGATVDKGRRINKTVKTV